MLAHRSQLLINVMLGSDFRKLMIQLTAVGAVLGLCAWAAAKVGGVTLLTLLYSPQYAAYASVFVRLMMAAGISAFASLLAYGLTSARNFRIQVPLYLMVLGSNAVGCALWVPSFGLSGAASAVMLSAVVQLTVFSITAFFLFLPVSKRVSAESAEYDLTVSL